MKKQFLIFAAITTIVFTSCSKEKIETPQTNQPEEIAGARGGGGGVIGTLDMGLLGRFEFQGNVNDTTGQIKPGTPVNGTPIYGVDRKGSKSSAIAFNEKYGVIMYDVPLESEMSVSFWMKYDMTPTNLAISFVQGSRRFAFTHFDNNRFQGSYWNFNTGGYIMSKPQSNTWHHMAATRDNNTYKFYIDGKLIGSSAIQTTTVDPITMSEYVIGYCYNAGVRYWKGSLDDLRIYKRVISATEIQALFNL